MTTRIARRGEAKGMTGWPKMPNPRPNQQLRLCVKCDTTGKSQLDLSHRGLNHIPKEVFMFQQLDVLKLNHNHLDQLPPHISYLHGVRTLHLHNNILTTLPPTLANCRHLTELDLTHNRLTSLPKGLGRLSKLKVLKLGLNQLEQIPHELGNLGNLRVLDLHGNKLWYIPFSLQNLYHLLRLDISNNLFDQIPLVVTKLTWLRALDVSANRLASLPPDFDQLRELRELNLSENRFVTLGVMATKLRQIKYLSLSHNRLQFLPDQITALKNMRVLHLKGNSLQSIPDGFLQLKYLNVSENALQDMTLLKTKELASLDASGNKLEYLPRGIYGLKNLRRLRLARNAITDIPEDIAWLKKLELLDLSDNDLRTLPSALHFMEKLTSFNVRGNHKISRVRIPEEEQAKKEKAKDDEMMSKLSTSRNKNGVNRPYSSMPSLHPDHSSSKQGSKRKSKASSEWPDPNTASKLDRSWLDNFLLAKPESKSWPDAADPTLRSERSIPYPTDSYDMGEIRASFSAESLCSEEEQKKSLQFRSSAAMSPMSTHSDNRDSALEDSFCSDETNNNEDENVSKSPGKKGKKWNLFSSSGHSKSATLVTADLRGDQTQRKIPFSVTQSWATMPSQRQTSSGTSARDQTQLKQLYSSTPNLVYSAEPNQGYQSATNSMPNPNQGDYQYHSAPNQAFYHQAPNQAYQNHSAPNPAFYHQAPYQPTQMQAYHTHAAYHPTTQNLGIYPYQHSEGGTTEPRQMNVLMTNRSNLSTSSKPNSHNSTLRKKKKNAEIESDSHNNLRSASNWTMRSHHSEPLHSEHFRSYYSEPLTIQTWTQTPGGEVAPFFPHEHPLANSGTQTNSQLMHAHQEAKSQSKFKFFGFKSPSGMALQHRGGEGAGFKPRSHSTELKPHSQSQANPSSFQSSHTLMPGGPAHLQPSPASSSTLQPLTSDSHTMAVSSGTLPASPYDNDMGARQDGGPQHGPQPTDYTLLGVCNQIQTLLHKDLLQPVTEHNGQQNPRFSNKTLRKSDNGAWHLGHTPQAGLEAGLEYSPGETFTTTERGGHYVSTFCPHVQVSVPPGAARSTLHVTLQQLTVANHVLKAIASADKYVSNIISIGPVVFLNALENVTFTCPVTLTLPAPQKVKGQPGHLMVMSVRPDNTCVPCTTAYQSSRCEVTLTTWHLTGKVAVLTKAKCKYKACKSVEHLLSTLNIITLQATPH